MVACLCLCVNWGSASGKLGAYRGVLEVQKQCLKLSSFLWGEPLAVPMPQSRIGVHGFNAQFLP